MKARIAVALAVVFAAACQQDRQAPTGLAGLERDSAGIRIMENPKPAEGSRLPWRIGPQPTVSIGKLEGREPYMLHRVIDAAGLSNGRIAVANRGSAEVRVFDAFGNHLVSVGGPGEGPGELRRLWRVAAWPGDSVIAWELGNGRFSVFGPRGNHGRSFVPRSDENPAEGWSLSFVDARKDGTIVYLVAGDADSTVVEIVDGEGERSASLGAHLDEEIVVARGSRGYSEPMPVAYSRELVTSLWGDLVVVATNNRYEIRAFRADGTLARIVRREHVLRVPTDADRRYFVDREMALRDGLDMPVEVLEEARRVLGSLPVAETFPAFSAMLGDDAGHLWVREYEFPREERIAHLWTVFDPAGRVLGFVETPKELRIHHIGADYILGHSSDELGVESIQVWPLERSGS